MVRLPSPLAIVVASIPAALLAACASGADGGSGPDGARGATSLTRSAAEPAGARCPAGGETIATGTDSNGNGVLDDAEITSSGLVCHGVTGAEGDAGAEGPRGETGEAGAPATAARFGVFTPTQVVEGAVVTCELVLATDTTTLCSGVAVAGLPLERASAGGDALCRAVTGVVPAVVNGGGSVGTFMTFGAGGWSLANGAAVTPALTVTCPR